MSPGLIERSVETTDKFMELAPSARKCGASQFEFTVDGDAARIRVRRAAQRVNQIHMHYGEPLVVHVPDLAAEGWYGLPVDWLLHYAILNPGSKQHTDHALDCMMIARDSLDESHMIPPSQMQARCEGLIRASRSKATRRCIRAIQRAKQMAVIHFEAAADVVSRELDA